MYSFWGVTISTRYLEGSIHGRGAVEELGSKMKEIKSMKIRGMANQNVKLTKLIRMR